MAPGMLRSSGSLPRMTVPESFALGDAAPAALRSARGVGELRLCGVSWPCRSGEGDCRARPADWDRLLELCGPTGTLICDGQSSIVTLLSRRKELDGACSQATSFHSAMVSRRSTSAASALARAAPTQ